MPITMGQCDDSDELHSSRARLSFPVPICGTFYFNITLLIASRHWNHEYIAMRMYHYINGLDINYIVRTIV